LRYYVPYVACVGWLETPLYPIAYVLYDYVKGQNQERTKNIDGNNQFNLAFFFAHFPVDKIVYMTKEE